MTFTRVVYRWVENYLRGMSNLPVAITLRKMLLVPINYPLYINPQGGMRQSSSVRTGPVLCMGR